MSDPIWYPSLYVLQFGLSSPNLRRGESMWAQAIDADGGVSEADLTNIGVAWDEEIAPICDSSVALTSLVAIGEFTRIEVPVNIVGEASYQLAAPNTTVLVRKDSNVRGPRAKARFQPYGHLDESAIAEDGTINPINLGDLRVAYQALFASIVAQDFIPVIQPRESDESPPPSAPIPVSGWTVQEKVSTQRRRLR